MGMAEDADWPREIPIPFTVFAGTHKVKQLGGRRSYLL